MTLIELDLFAVLVIAFAYFLAGISKGTIGFGLPLVAVPLVATIMPVPTAIALTLVPILSANIYQTFTAARPATILRRYWLLILFLVIGTALGAQVLTRVNQGTISIVVGLVLLVFVMLQGFDLRLEIPARAQRWLDPIVGFVSGLLGGVAGMMGPPFIIYLVSMRMPRDIFVGTISQFYLIGIIPLYVTLIASGIIAQDEAIASLLACAPLFAGIALGTWLRGKVSQTGFKRALLAMIFLVGLNLIRRGVF